MREETRVEQGDRLADVRKTRKRLYRSAVVKTILEIAGVAGAVTIATLAPNAIGALYGNKASKQKQWYVWQVIKRLEHEKLLTRKGVGTHSRYELTNRGRDTVAGYEIGKLSIRKPLDWDGKWRLVIFDIGEKKRFVRDELRDTLDVLGFQKLQHSVWVHPYPCAEIISLIKRKHNLNKDVLYLEIDILENDSWLRDIFFLN